MKTVISTAIAAFALTGAAVAADLPARDAAPAPAPAYSVGYDWTGFYVGGQIGYIQNRDKASVPLLAFIGASQSYSANSAIGGVYAGYNWQMNSLVLGVEADANIFNTSKTTNAIGGFVFGPPSNVRVRSTYQVGLVAKAGVAFDRALLYVLAGGTLANVDARYNLFATSQTSDSSRLGWTVGAGMAYAFNANWSARVEYRYTNFGTKNDGLVNFAPLSVSHRVDSHRFMGGLTYRFGGPAAPVVAKY
ncbi:MAG: outer membrane protein [Beijerinckiaceae bacterium]